ncbi:hypothetical protein [Streptomyces sp. MZ04]|uniref:hypothetical protein n=1 Tax=Streptomyces sp. MZ04 TaxID=2559236 RepID=UPI001432D75D|nr:hypothetical protein [Streptomyces sp. MZ04]
MPAYLIIHAERRREDMLVEDPALTLQIRDGWAIPTEHVACIQRVDPEPEDQKPAPEE